MTSKIWTGLIEYETPKHFPEEPYSGLDNGRYNQCIFSKCFTAIYLCVTRDYGTDTLPLCITAL